MKKIFEFFQSFWKWITFETAVLDYRARNLQFDANIIGQSYTLVAYDWRGHHLICRDTSGTFPAGVAVTIDDAFEPDLFRAIFRKLYDETPDDQKPRFPSTGVLSARDLSG